MVVLRHTPEGQGEAEGEHFDLLLERDRVGALLAFRLEQAIDLGVTAEFMAERNADHRRVYLDYEGPVPAPGSESSPNGEVRRVMEGECMIHVEGEGEIEVTLAAAGVAGTFGGVPMGPGRPGWWWFTRR